MLASKNWLIMIWVIFGLLIACSKKPKTNTDVTKEPVVEPREETKAEEPKPKEPAKTGPIAGSVWDVIHRTDERLPKDVIDAMKEYGVDTKMAPKLWQRLIIDINDDGARELMLSNAMEWCGSGGCGVWLWQKTPQGLHNLLPTEQIVAVAVEVEEATTSEYHNLRFYHRKFNDDDQPILVSDLYVWTGSIYRYESTANHGQYLKTALPASAWKTTL